MEFDSIIKDLKKLKKRIGLSHQIIKVEDYENGRRGFIIKFFKGVMIDNYISVNEIKGKITIEADGETDADYKKFIEKMEVANAEVTY